MWGVGLCAFPPLFKDLPITLAKKNAIAEQEFVVKVDKSYVLSINFYSSTQEQKELVNSIVGSRYEN